jgi:hypothetical protein
LKLLNLEKDEEDLEDDGQPLETKLATALSILPEVYKDVWAQKAGIDIVKKKFDLYLAGNVPVKGQFRYAVQDPYAILRTLRDAFKVDENGEFIKRDSEGRYIIPENDGIPAGCAFLLGSKVDGKKIFTGKVGVGRVPCLTAGEMRTVELINVKEYANAKYGAFENVIILSAHDLNMEAMGGGDFDGDKVQILLDEVVINAIDRYMSLPVVLDAGCPWKDEKIDSSKFTISFTNEEYNNDSREIYKKFMALNREFVALSLAKNKIGYLTNIGTKLADGIRSLASKLRFQTEAERKATLAEMEDLRLKTLFMRRCVGWEIDRPKHGGAYEEALAEQLSFIEDPPPSVSYVHKNKRLWTMPSWLYYNKYGKFGGKNTKSVLCNYHEFVKSYMAKFDKKAEDKIFGILEELAGERKKSEHCIIGEMTAAITVDPTIVKAIENEIVPIKKSYGDEMKYVIRQKEEMEKAGMNKKKVEKFFKTAAREVSEKHQGLVTALEEFFLPEEIAYVAYVYTYSNVKKTQVRDEDGNIKEGYSSFSFPWVCCTSQMMAALRIIAGKAPGKEYKIAPTSLSFAFGTNYNAEKLSEQMTATNDDGTHKRRSSVVFEDGKYVVVVEGHVVGNVYSDHAYKFSGKGESVELFVLETTTSSNTVRVTAIF